MSEQIIGQIIAFIGLVGGGVTSFVKLNTKVQANFVMIQNLKEENKKIEQDHKLAYSQLDNKITLMDNEIKQISRDTAEIKGYIMQMAQNKN